MAGEECDFNQLSALLSESDDEDVVDTKTKHEEAHVSDPAADQSSDDDIDDDELDRLAGLVEQEQASPPQKIVNDAKPMAKEEKSELASSQLETEKDGADAQAEMIRIMQEKINALQAQLLEGKKENTVKVETPPVKEKPRPSVKSSANSTPDRQKSASKLVDKDHKSSPKLRKLSTPSSSKVIERKSSPKPSVSSTNKGTPRVLKEMDFLSTICPSLPAEKKPEKVASAPPKPARTTMLTGDDPKVAAKEELEKAAIAMFGDDDSDWDDLDGESSKILSEEGEDLQRLLRVKSNKGARVAHQPAPDRPAPDRSFLNNRSPTWGKKAPALSKSPAPGGGTSQKALQEPDDPNVTRDMYSGIRIKNPLISSTQMRIRMENRTMIKMSTLHQKSKSSLEGDWVTIGVLVQKSDPKTSQKGNQFSIWTLSDLQDCEHQVKMFLFGETHKGHWKTVVGSVVGLLNPSLMQNNEKYQNKSDELSITVDHPQKVMPMGTSKDLGFCKSKTKAGRACFNFINKTSGEHCSFHVQSAYKKSCAKRSEIQASHSAPVPKSFEKKIFGKTSVVNYGGQTFTGSSEKPKKKASVSSLAEHGTKAIQGKKSTLFLHNIMPEDLEKLKKQSDAKKAEEHKIFHEMLSVPSAGSGNLVKHLIKKDITPAATSSAEKDKAVVKSISAKDLLKEHARNMAQKKLERTLKTQRQRPSTGPMIDLDEPISTAASTDSLNKIPKLGRGLIGGPLRTQNVAAERAKKQAIFAIQEKGGIKKANPNAIKKSLSEESREKIRKRLSTSDTEDDVGSSEEPPQKKSRLLGGLDPDDPEVKKLMAVKSRHAGQLTEIEEEKQEAYFSKLEKKEAMENKMMSIKTMKCKVVSCNICKYTALSPKESCKVEHAGALYWSNGTKNFFVCSDCKTRTVALDKYPTKPCSGCGGTSFKRTTMMKDKTAKAPGTELNLRGEEIKYLNSLK